MKKFLLLLLAFVLPMQMSWAATHFYVDDLTHIAAGASGVAKVAHEHAKANEAGKKSDSKNFDQLAECCSAAHGCHGLHHLMPHSEASLSSACRAGVVAARDGPTTCGFLATRVERPKWLAA